jgi:hypothetical protein
MGVLPTLLPRDCHLDSSVGHQSYLAQILFIRTLGMAVAMFDLLEMATIQKNIIANKDCISECHLCAPIQLKHNEVSSAPNTDTVR